MIDNADGDRLTVEQIRRTRVERIVARDQSDMTSRISDVTLFITPPEQAVLQLLADGKSISAIGDHLNVSAQEVDSHLMQLFERIGASSREHAIDLARRRGLVYANVTDLCGDRK